HPAAPEHTPAAGSRRRGRHGSFSPDRCRCSLWMVSWPVCGGAFAAASGSSCVSSPSYRSPPVNARGSGRQQRASAGAFKHRRLFRLGPFARFWVRMRVGITLPGGVHPQDAGRLAAQAEAAGCEAVWILDVRREPYLLAAAAVQATRRVQVGTNVAVAFARSPTVTATAAWDLAIWSGGRFVLGLGSQVGPTLNARFGVTADHPGPRMLDYVRAVRGCFTAFRDGRGRYDGAFYQIARPAFQPGGEDLEPDPPIYLAAV